MSVDDGYTATVIFPRNEEMTIITHGSSGIIQPTDILGVKKQVNTPMLPVPANSYLTSD
jgi:hypothetical protein